MKAYLLALEVQPVEVGKTYVGLPLHCTLVHWFWLNSPEATIEPIWQLLKNRSQLVLHIGDEEEFTGLTKDGPLPVVVNKVVKSSELISLHEEVVKILSSANAEYSMPQYIHSGYVPHVTHQKESRVSKGDSELITSMYIAEAIHPAYGNERTIVAKFDFNLGVVL